MSTRIVPICDLTSHCILSYQSSELHQKEGPGQFREKLFNKRGETIQFVLKETNNFHRINSIFTEIDQDSMDQVHTHLPHVWHQPIVYLLCIFAISV